jgi:hypothetical protein
MERDRPQHDIRQSMSAPTAARPRGDRDITRSSESGARVSDRWYAKRTGVRSAVGVCRHPIVAGWTLLVGKIPLLVGASLPFVDGVPASVRWRRTGHEGVG